MRVLFGECIKGGFTAIIFGNLSKLTCAAGPVSHVEDRQKWQCQLEVILWMSRTMKGM